MSVRKEASGRRSVQIEAEVPGTHLDTQDMRARTGAQRTPSLTNATVAKTAGGGAFTQHRSPFRSVP
jgi:hypothetical protein